MINQALLLVRPFERAVGISDPKYREWQSMLMVKGVDDEFNDELITQLEKMPTWKPAMVNDKGVPKKMKQSIEISAQ